MIPVRAPEVTVVDAHANGSRPRLAVVDRPVGLDDVRVHLVDDTDTAGEFMRWLSTRDVVGFDTETTGLNDDVDVPRMVQYGDDRHGWAIPIERLGWGGLVVDAVRRFDGAYTMHNSPYDCRMMENVGVVMPRHRVRNTRIMAHVLSSTEPLALKWQACKYVDPRSATGQQRLEDAIGRHGGWTWANVPVDFEPYWAYAAIDPVLTYQLDQVHYPRVLAEAPRSYDLEVAVEWVCERMERRGARVDRDYVRTFQDELLAFVRDATAWCKTTYGVSPGKNSEVIRQLSADGCELTKLTDGGALSLDKHVLAEFSHHPLAQVVLDRRRAEKTASTYLRHYLEGSERDGLIHPSINTVGGTDKNPFESGGSGRGVRTTRMSMSDPNLQNVPIRTAFGAKIRNSFWSREDHTWVKFDFDQIEMRLLAHLSGDAGMIEAFRSPGDFFVNMARNIFQDPTITKKDPRRQPVKNSGYAKIYGAGIEQFARTAGMTKLDWRVHSTNEDGSDHWVQERVLDLQGASAFLQRFDELYPGANRLAREIEAEARLHVANSGEAYVRSPMTGRKHTADQRKLYALLNYVIQGTAGEILKLKIVELDAAGVAQYMLFPVHDECDLDVPNSELGDVLDTLHDVVNDDRLLDVPITASVAIGQRWGSLVELGPEVT